MELIVVNLPAFCHEQFLQWEIQLQANCCEIGFVEYAPTYVELTRVHFCHYFMHRVIFDFHLKCLVIWMPEYNQRAIKCFLQMLTLQTNSSMLFLTFPKKRQRG